MKELKNLNSRKSAGLDEIPALFLKDGADIHKSPITSIINRSIKTSTVLDDFKHAKVTPIHKKTRNLKLEITGPLVFYL